MKKAIIASLSVACLAMGSCSGNKDNALQLNKNNIDEIVNAMTLEEKSLLLVGIGMPGMSGTETVVGETDMIIPGAAGVTNAIPRLGIPSIVLADGPAGLRIKPTRENDSKTYYCTAFPVGVCLAASWNKQLVEQTGEAIGNEVREYGCDILLAPGTNIQRNPLCGRNYEYYSEDPILSGMTAAAYIKGVQKMGVGTSIKHFALNNQETNRSYMDSRASERAKREIYYKPFEIAIKEAKPWTVMSSYNYIDGVYASQNPTLLQDVLRGEWGYKGLVMTDWFGGDNGAANIQSGNDLIMPGSDDRRAQIIEAYKKGELSDEALNASVKRTLELIVKCPTFNGYQYSNNPDLKAHAQISRNNACEGIVLLKNNDNTLPITSKSKNIALFGITSYCYNSGGIGSGDVNEAYTVDLLEGMKNAGFNLDTKLAKKYQDSVKEQTEKYDKEHAGKNDAIFAKFTPKDFAINGNEIEGYALTNELAIITLGRMSGEFADRHISEFYLKEEEKNLINQVSETFHKNNKKVVVVLNICGAMETASWRDKVDAILVPWLGGQEGGNAVADVLSGKVNPSGKLPMTFYKDYFDTPGAKNFPYDKIADAKSMFGDKAVNRDSIENYDYTIYSEDIFVGYRGLEKEGKEAAYPFGYGLSYTTFQIEDLKVERKKTKVIIKVTIKNSGDFPGKEVAQLFVTSPHAEKHPLRELLDYQKTDKLIAGQSQELTFDIDFDRLSCWDEELHSSTMDIGEYTFQVGDKKVKIKL